MKTPVAFFIFNRPEHTARVLRAIAVARPERLLIVADGPRDQAERSLCDAARVAAQAVDWPCRVTTEFAATNLGNRRRFASGLDWVFSQTERAIVLEDDCLPDATFFPFCEELLERYADSPRVQMIGGSNYTPGRRFTAASYYFSRFYHIWGWATWARAWRTYDEGMREWTRLRSTDWVERLLPEARMAQLARNVFDAAQDGRLPQWDYPWVLAGWRHDALAALPATNLVTNIGFGAGATSTHSLNDPLAALPLRPLTFPLHHPQRIEVLEAADRHEWDLLNPAQLTTGWRQRWRAFVAAGRYAWQQ